MEVEKTEVELKLLEHWPEGICGHKDKGNI